MILSGKHVETDLPTLALDEAHHSMAMIIQKSAQDGTHAHRTTFGLDYFEGLGVCAAALRRIPATFR